MVSAGIGGRLGGAGLADWADFGGRRLGAVVVLTLDCEGLLSAGAIGEEDLNGLSPGEAMLVASNAITGTISVNFILIFLDC